METLDISQVAKRSGVPASTLRYYEEKGLIRSVGRRASRRLFDVGILQQLELIALGQSGGFTLEEISQMFGPGGQLRIQRKLLLAKANELDQTMRRMVAMRDTLRHAAACPAKNHLECPQFMRLLRRTKRGS